MFFSDREQLRIPWKVTEESPRANNNALLCMKHGWNNYSIWTESTNRRVVLPSEQLNILLIRDTLTSPRLFFLWSLENAQTMHGTSSECISEREKKLPFTGKREISCTMEMFHIKAIINCFGFPLLHFQSWIRRRSQRKDNFNLQKDNRNGKHLWRFKLKYSSFPMFFPVFCFILKLNFKKIFDILIVI